MITNINGIDIHHPDNLAPEAIQACYQHGIDQWMQDKKRMGALGRIVVERDGLEWKINPQAHITRVRRITGYLSEMKNFNDAKQEELSDRYKHLSNDQMAIRG